MINIRIISTNIGFFVKTIPLVVKLFLFLGFSLSFHYIFKNMEYASEKFGFSLSFHYI